jgi:hypothetical protein
MEEIKEEKFNIDNIIEAGNSLKRAVSFMFILILISIIGIKFISDFDEIDKIKSSAYLLGIICLVFNFIILFCFYEAGDYLKNVKSSNRTAQGKNSLTENQEQLEPIQYVHYHTDKGVVEIPPCINLIGQPALQNGQPAPDGKYKYGFMKNFHIENGIIVKG